MKRKGTLLITKASGESADFSEEKLRTSLARSGGDNELIDIVIKKVKRILYPGITTKKIYKTAHSLLKSIARPVAAKYHLKYGIMELGPSGYPFEQYVGELLKHQGYKITLGKIVQGKCVKHEIDVIAEKDNHHFMIECKYHNLPGNISDVKIPLYIQSRFKDVEASWIKISGHASKFHQGWVITNTRFTDDAIQYGNCAGLNLVSWDYPKRASLRALIDSSGLYPVTCLTTLTRSEKSALLKKNIVLCREISSNQSYLKKIGLKHSRIQSILNESRMICQKLK